ncbi:hypothetical protein ACQB60_20655 [Actinomycetota bacterium Odt1-20B]
MTDDEVVEELRERARALSLPAPATEAAVTEAELVIGFPLPPLLRRLYLEVANGGFGPGEGIVGVRGGASQGDRWPQGVDLAQWLGEAMNNTLSVHRLLASQPAR